MRVMTGEIDQDSSQRPDAFTITPANWERQALGFYFTRSERRYQAGTRPARVTSTGQRGLRRSDQGANRRKATTRPTRWRCCDCVALHGRNRPTAAGQCRRPNCPGADIRGTLSAGTHCRQGIAPMRSGLVPEHGPMRHPKSTLRRSGSNSRSLNANTQGSHCAQAQVIGNSA